MSSSTIDLNSQALRDNPYPELQRILAMGPLVHTRLPIIGPTWTLTSYAAVDDFLRDSQRFVRDPAKAGKRFMAGMQWWMPRTLRAMANNMMARDGDDHQRLRLLVEKAFRRRNVEGMRPRLEQITDELIDELERIEQRDGQVDFLEHFARPLPLIVICELLGLPDADRPKFRHWFAPIGKIKSGWGFFRLLPGMWKLRGYLIEQIDSCRRDPREGLMSALVEAEESGDRLDSNELLATMFLLLAAGSETTTHLLTSGLLTLLDHPDQAEQLKLDWSKGERAVDEIMRYTSPFQMTKPRFAAEDMELYGEEIKRGQLLIAFIASANVDPQEFVEPERFDIERTPNRHVGFGKGIHTCLGLQLAKLETQIAYERLFTRHPNVSLAVNHESLPWSTRIGLRTVSALPIQFN
jgi:cytochrome P450